MGGLMNWKICAWIRSSIALTQRYALRVLPALAVLLSGGLLLRPGNIVAGMGDQKHAQPSESPNLGSWSAPFGIPVIGVHAALLTNGNVLFFYSDQPQGSGGSLGAIWNPVTNAVTVDNLPYDFN